MQKKLLVCLPAFNEAESIQEVLRNILEFRDSFRDFDVLVIDDGSSDRTRDICLAENVPVISHVYNLGYGAALKTAYKYASEHGYDYIIQMDSDGQHDVSNIGHMYNALADESGRAPDILIGSRFLDGSSSFPIPPHKKIVINIFRFIIKTATKSAITDPTSGLQGLSRNAFNFYAQFENFATDYPDANMIIQMALNNFLVKEIPAVMHNRVKGVSMHSGIYKPLKYIVKMTLSVLIVCIRGMFDRNKSASI